MQRLPNSDYSPQTMLYLNLLGNYSIAIDTTPEMKLHGRKAAAVLFYLVISKAPVKRTRLAALLWPGKDISVAKNNLRTTLATLKKSLATHLIIRRTTITFNWAAPYSLDIELLDKELNSGLATKNIDQLQRAIALYEGELLQGFQLRNAETFDEWLSQQREQLHLQVVQALETLLRLCMTQKAYQVGLAASRRLLQIELWSEVAHEHLMMLLVATGQREHALHQYEIYCRILKDEIGVEPSTEINLLYDRIRSGAFADAVSAIDDQQPQTTALISIDATQRNATQDTPVQYPALSQHLTHRQQREWQQLPPPPSNVDGYQSELHYVVQRLRATNCRLFTIVGATATGKTSLAIATAHQFFAANTGDFPDGIIFVPLKENKWPTELEIDTEEDIENIDASIASRMLLDAIANQVNVARKQESNRACDLSSIVMQLQHSLRGKKLLLILDGFDSVMAATNQLITLLTCLPQLKALITSRSALKVRGESLLPLHTAIKTSINTSTCKQESL